MAAAETVRKHLTCSICLEVFKKPKTLPCLHSFCEACLEEHIRSFCQTNKTFECPLCRAETHLDQQSTNDQWAKSYPTNHFIVSLIEDEVLQTQARSVDKNLAIECVPCSLDAKSVKAFCFCIQCVEYLCKECFEVHRKFKATRTHEVLKGNELPEDVTAFNKLSKIRFCNKHPDKEIEFKCNDDDILFCSMCVTSEHKTCESIKHISSIDEESQTKIDSFLERIISLKMDVEKTLNRKLQEADNLDKESKSVANSSTEIIDKLKEYIKYIENRFITQYSEHIESEHKKHANAIGECLGLVEKLDMMINVISTVLKYGSRVQKAVVINRLKDDETNAKHLLAEQKVCSSNYLKEYLHKETEALKEILQLDFSDNLRRMCGAEICPEAKEKCSGGKNTAHHDSDIAETGSRTYHDDLGNSLDKQPRCRGNKHSLIKCNVRKIGEHDISVPVSDNPCHHNGSLFMNNGNMIFIDRNNNHVKIIDPDFKVTCCITVDEKPLDLGWRMNSKIAIVTKYKLCVVDLLNNKEFGSIIYFHDERDNAFRSICRAGNDFAILMCNEEKKSFIEIRNKKHKLQETMDDLTCIKRGKVDLTHTKCVRSRKEGELIFCEPRQLRAFSRVGVEQWYYAPSDLQHASNVTFDTEKNIYVCDLESDNIIQIAAYSYKFSRILIDGIQRPTSILFNPINQTLIIGCHDDSKVHVYEFL